MNDITKYEDHSCLNKVRYKTRERAEQAYKSYIKNMQRNRGRRVKKLKHKQYPYKCVHCGNWHLATK